MACLEVVFKTFSSGVTFFFGEGGGEGWFYHQCLVIVYYDLFVSCGWDGMGWDGMFRCAFWERCRYGLALCRYYLYVSVWLLFVV